MTTPIMRIRGGGSEFGLGATIVTEVFVNPELWRVRSNS